MTGALQRGHRAGRVEALRRRARRRSQTETDASRRSAGAEAGHGARGQVVTWLVVVTRIEAPIERCFDLARSVDAHNESAAFSGERAVPPGRTSGLLDAGETLTFEGARLAVRHRITARITPMVLPHLFLGDLG